MLVKNRQLITFEEFLKLDSSDENLYEFIDGTIYNQASPSTTHQRTSGNLYYELRKYFENKPCEVFSAPFDIILKDETEQYKSKVIPDLSVICDKDGLNDKNYIGIPTLIIEILSPSNQAHDLVTKLNLYQRFGIKEYWIVNPKLNSIQIYTLNEEGLYEQFGIYKGNEILESKVFDGLKIELNIIFKA